MIAVVTAVAINGGGRRREEWKPWVAVGPPHDVQMEAPVFGFKILPTLAAVVLGAGIATGNGRAAFMAALALLALQWVIGKVRS
ncbi:hypothetical protein ACFYTC_24160 [Actinomadura nitritigenes]|uniref:hypothetical protein n=1 Tax=Actinomadura TaxID=1988 RepID=UPI001686E237|nr:hypothetical protein [Actinomadura sp. RB99]